MDARRSRPWLIELLESVVPALLIVIIINVFLGQTTQVDGLSMEPSLADEQRLIIEKVTYRLHGPERGDIVVLRLPDRRFDRPLIKRVIGLPGEIVEIREGGVYVDGEGLEEPYLSGPTPGFMKPRLVPEGHVMVLGDNRGSSNDSRSFGMVPIDDILGRAWVRYWPIGEVGLVH
jgi:signal peptidase I